MRLLDYLETESIFILRETAAQCKKPVLLFSGGKDSLVLLRLAEKAFWPEKVPFPIMHIDTGHNFPEVLEFRDKTIARLGLTLIVRRVEDSIFLGRTCDLDGPFPSRNALQTVTLLDAINEFEFDAAIGGARRDEEKSRAKERVFSVRDNQGHWDPQKQRPELWNLYNGRVGEGGHLRVFPLSHWTELDVWRYVQVEELQLPSLYFSHTRDCLIRGRSILPAGPYLGPTVGESITQLSIRFRTVGDMTCSSAVESKATTISEVIHEIMASKSSERSGRVDDQVSDWSMEERKRAGYF
ncbi:MAG: sulfate adenylyltransferase subunit 2 [Oligoflexia bacterium]|nr:sulfate adenylyltransferase subunit 2 [Oligoflexia bacterium]